MTDNEIIVNDEYDNTVPTVPGTFEVSMETETEIITETSTSQAGDTDTTQSNEALGENTSKGTSRRGRPRPNEVMHRDELVYGKLDGTMTRKQLTEATGLAQSLVYLSLLRLRTAGRVKHSREQQRGHVWTRITDVPATETTGMTSNELPNINDDV